MPEVEPRPRDDGEYASIPLAAGLRAPTLATYWRTLRHLRWSQLSYLVLRRVLPRSKSLAKAEAPVGLRSVTGPWPFMEWQPEASRKMLATREFTFLNRSVASKGSIAWNDRREVRLWLYHLNYFDFVNVGFALPEEEPLLQAVLEIMLDWCTHNTAGTEVGWEPYALSVRIVNWLKFLTRYGRSRKFLEEKGSIDTLVESVGVQAATLEHRLEKELLGNHLLMNIKALLFAGALLDTPSSARWWATGGALLEQQLNEQILPDGGHFERSPGYHAHVLEDLAEIQLLCAVAEKRPAWSDVLSRKIQLMAHFLKGVLHPDGEIPLFSDSVLGAGCPPTKLLSVTEGHDQEEVKRESPVTVFPDTGYGVIRNPDTRSTLIFDCGPLGPDYQPGHSHCDVLSYELSLHGQRVVVDTGVSTYEPGAERSYERSTAAHNTLRIDGEEQAEIWASFRVGRRPRVGQIRGGNKGAFSFVGGEHEAYQRLGVIHARTILWLSPDTWIVADLLRGSGVHLVESFLHFHPRVRIQALADLGETAAGLPLHRWTVEFDGQSYLLAAYGAGQFDLLKSWYAERFGYRQPSMLLRSTWRGTIPTGMIHFFTPLGASLPNLEADWAAKSIEIDGHMIPLC